MQSRRGLVVWSALLLAACGSTSGGGVGLEEACDDLCARQLRCSGTPVAECEPTCRTSAPVFRADLVEVYSECIRTLDCAGSDDTCEEAVFNEVPNAEALVSSCIEQYRASCPNASEIDESICLSAAWLTEAAQAELLDCFAGPTCGEACADAVLGR